MLWQNKGLMYSETLLSADQFNVRNEALSKDAVSMSFRLLPALDEVRFRLCFGRMLIKCFFCMLIYVLEYY